MNQLKSGRRKAVIAALVEGASINSTVRMTGVAKTTVLRLLEDLGCACAAYHNEHVRGLKPRSVQCDEVWSFLHCKQKHVKAAKAQEPSKGDAWTWTALDRDSKVIITYLVGLRTPDDAQAFMLDLAGRVTNHTQLTTNELGSNPETVRNAFGDVLDLAQLIKVYREDRQTEARYSPAVCAGCEHETVVGFPDPDLISTSHVEPSNLTIRMSMRRFNRLTNGHSKKIENHGHALALFVMHYNYCRKHMSLGGRMPAMVAGLADHVWTLDELVGLIS